MDWFTGTSALLTALSVLFGVMLPIVTKFVVDYIAKKKQIEDDETKRQFSEVRTEREDIAQRTKTHLDLLETQIIKLQEEVELLKTANINYIKENVQLHCEVKLLRARIVELEKEVKELSSAELK